MKSVFSQLDAPGERIWAQPRAKARLLPRVCGTYAFYDRQGQLLYIGKAKNVRSRVLAHLRETKPRVLIPPWTRLIAQIEVRPAHSETEALLVEADLIARSRPFFNRRMKSWRKYCYIVETDDPLSPFSVSLQLAPWKHHFGPYPTRRQAVRIIEALHFVLQEKNTHGGVRRRIRDLLSGSDDTLAAELERRCEHPSDAEESSPRSRSFRDCTETLRKAFLRGRLLRESAAAWEGLVFVSQVSGILTFVFVTPAGLHLHRVNGDDEGMSALLECYRKTVSRGIRHDARHVPKQLTDVLCLVARGARRRRSPLMIRPWAVASSASAKEMREWYTSHTGQA